MHQLKALLWRSYKVRSRQYYTSGLDLLGPIVIILLYLATKLLLNQTHAPQVDESAAKLKYFHRDTNAIDGTTTFGDHIDLKRDIRRHMCTEILYFPGNFDEPSSSLISSHLTDKCGFRLAEVSSRRELVRGLKRSLASRMAYRRPQADLNKINSTSDNCIKLPQAREGNNDTTIFQIGLARTGKNVVEIHMTDSAGSSVIFMPYSQGSTYNEYKFPQSDLNLGTHLIEICLADAFGQTKPSQQPTPTPTPGPSSSSTRRPTATPPSSLSPRAGASLSDLSLESSGGHESAPTRLSRDPMRAIATAYGDAMPRLTGWSAANIKWRYKPYPVQTGVFVLPISTAIAILMAYLCTHTATVMRVSEEIEFGLHRYARLAGLPAGYYWLSQLILTTIQSFVQGLIVAILLGIPTGEYTYDPIADSVMTTRWMLLFTYSIAANSHAIFFSSLFDRSSNALMVCCLVASTYAEYSLLMILQWSPYRFDSMAVITWFTLLNPASAFLALSCVLISVVMQTNENFGWSHLSERIVGGGFSEYSVGELWALLLVQILVNFGLTVLVDQYKYSTTNNIFSFMWSLVSELLFCNCCSPHADQPADDARTRSQQVPTPSRRDPNRICCSLRHVDVSGATIMVPLTRGNPLKMSREQVRAIRAFVEERTVSKTTQLVVNARTPGAPASQREQPIFLDDVIKQNVIWYETEIKFKELNLDFRFNQITYVLGQTNLKELLFSALLGVCPLTAGRVIIDGTSYTAATMGLARKQLGYLSDKDIFYNDLTIFENLQFFGSIRETAYKSFDSESLYVLSLLHLSSRRNGFPSSLTQRSARKLALGVASVGYTKLLLLTEPTLNLRWRPRCQVLNLLRKYKSIRSIVVDSSDVDEAVAFGDRIVLLKNGSCDLSDAPERLAKRLACGYWLVFEPTSGNGRTLDPVAMRALERLTNELFKQDKLNMDASKASIYQDFAATKSSGARMFKATEGGGAFKTAPSSPTTVPQNDNNKIIFDSGTGATAAAEAAARGQVNEPTRRLMVIVKVHHSTQSCRALCTLLKMFANRNIHGFKLAQVSYESLEDVLVLRMSRALYPDLPPDLLLSLQHRTQLSQRSPEPSPISVRKLTSSGSGAPNSTSTNGTNSPGAPTAASTIFAAGLATIVRDRLRNRAELFVTLVALIVSLIVVSLTLHTLKSTLMTGGSQSAAAAAAAGAGATTSTTANSSSSHPRLVRFMSRATRDRRIVELSSIELLYKYRLGFYVIDRGSRTNNNRTKEATEMAAAAAAAAVAPEAPVWPLADATIGATVASTTTTTTITNPQETLYGANATLRRAYASGNLTHEADGALLLQAWRGNKNLAGVLHFGNLRNKTDAEVVASLVDKSRDLASALIVFDARANEATVIFEPHSPHVFLASIKTFLDFSYTLSHGVGKTTRRSATRTNAALRTLRNPADARQKLLSWSEPARALGDGPEAFRERQDMEDYVSPVYTSRVNYRHTWHEMVHGYPLRRLIYGFGLAIAEAIFMGALVMAPMRHRSESKLTRVHACYWLSLGLFDLTLSLIHVACYILLFISIEGIQDARLIGAMSLVLFLYKLASLPIPYLTSLAAESSLHAFLFIFMLYFTVAWDMAVFLRAFVEWTLYSDSYLYTMSNWILFGMPITGLIESLVTINQVSTISNRCPEVPAYTATTNTVGLEGIMRQTVVDTLLDKVRECLANGKMFISTDVLHRQGLGIMWSIYLILLFGLIIWAFLLTSERLFGIVARRLSSTKTSNDPMKTVIRLPDHTSSLFMWDKERDRLISEYVRCMNEFKYANSMAHNCLILRIWLKPMSDQERHLSAILEPLTSLGYNKNEIQIELRTTLQIFVRIGDETRHCRVDKIQLIEAYSRFVAAHGDSVAKFAVVDWTRENLYKILLHGHYNNKTTTSCAAVT